VSELPAIDQSLLPADVRSGTTADKQRYSSALGFEKMLVQQLTQQLSDTTKPAGSDDDSGDDGSSATTNAYNQMLPGVMADAITGSGGLGLARQLYDGLKASGE
jgi:Rod binding domain-containing protein